jgi:TonB family protein
MMRILIPTTILLAAFLLSTARGQDAERTTDGDETCPWPVYHREEVSRPAEFRLPDVEITEEARAKMRRGTVALRAVLCRTGRVTDIVVTKRSPYGMTERVMEAVRGMKFEPAERDGDKVSQSARMEFNFNVY